MTAEQSATPDEAGQGASLAIDLNLETYSLTIPGPDGTIWLKVLLGKIHCVDQVIWYNSFDGPDLTWTCSENDCSDCIEDPLFCHSHTLTVSYEQAVSDLPPVAGCKYGDAVKLVSVSRDIIMTREIVIIGKQEDDCTKMNSTWSKVVTVPVLPVIHGTTLTLNCDTDYTNNGGNTATCLYGQVVSTNQDPYCREMRRKLVGETTPSSVEHSCTVDRDETKNGPENAVDLNYVSRSYTGPDSDGTSWFQATLDKVHCVDFVIIFDTEEFARTWRCSEKDCSVCGGDKCNDYTLTVSIQGQILSDLPLVSDCVNGNTVKLEKTNIGQFYLFEIAIIVKIGVTF
ncbi:hypothetical protein ACHWQZ_G001641 [Mnemiopsis leidyi]